MNWIEHIIEPKRLLLVWQAPEHFGDRRRYAVGEVMRDGDGLMFQYFTAERFPIENPGADWDRVLVYGFKGYPAFRKSVRYHEGVLEAFLRRLPPRGRSDFSAYQEHFRIKPGSEISDFALLGYTEAKLPNDGFSLVDPLDPNVERCELLIEVAGFRHHWHTLRSPHLGAQAELRAEPQNEQDPLAIAVHLGDARIGYINRLQAPTFRTWISERRVEAVLERLNGTSDRPRAYIFVRVSPPQAAFEPGPRANVG